MSSALLSLHDHVAQQLREMIFSGALAPGAWVDELSVCEQLSISRTPLREALKVLKAEGLIRHEPRQGSFVYEVTEQDLDDIFPVIALLEGRCAFEAASQASEADIEQLQVLHDRLQDHAKAGRIGDYYATNLLIHEAIIHLAGNRWLAHLIADLRKILKLARLQQLRAPGRLEKSLQEHMAIFAAIRARDCVSAEIAMRTHLDRQRDALRNLQSKVKT